jgi:hypothetical protein
VGSSQALSYGLGGRGAVYIDPAAAPAWLRRLGDEMVRGGGILVIIEGDSEADMDDEAVLIPVRLPQVQPPAHGVRQVCQRSLDCSFYFCGVDQLLIPVLINLAGLGGAPRWRTTRGPGERS